MAGKRRVAGGGGWRSVTSHDESRFEGLAVSKWVSTYCASCESSLHPGSSVVGYFAARTFFLRWYSGSSGGSLYLCARVAAHTQTTAGGVCVRERERERKGA